MTAYSSSQADPRPFRIVVADNDLSYRDVLVAGLSALGTLEVAAAATNSADAVIDAWQHRPDVVLLGVGLPGMSAADTTRHILRAAPGAAVCLLASSETDPGISAALDAGARDCLVRTESPEQIARTLKRAAGGRA